MLVVALLLAGVACGGDIGPVGGRARRAGSARARGGAGVGGTGAGGSRGAPVEAATDARAPGGASGRAALAGRGSVRQRTVLQSTGFTTIDICAPIRGGTRASRRGTPAAPPPSCSTASTCAADSRAAPASARATTVEPMTATQAPPRWDLDPIFAGLEDRTFNNALEGVYAGVDRLVALYDELDIRATATARDRPTPTSPRSKRCSTRRTSCRPSCVRSRPISTRS